MKKLVYVFFVTFLISCGKGKLNVQDTASLQSLKSELMSKFGENAFYTNLSIVNSDHGAVVTASQTSEPSSLKMSDWSYFQGKWEQKSEITLEIPEGSKAEDFMFQLNKLVNFDTLAKAVEASKKKVIEEKKIEDVKVELITINTPRNGNINSMQYFITIKPKQGGTQFNFWYNMDGSLAKFDY